MFSLAGLETVEQGVALFRIVDNTPARLWAGTTKRQRTKYCTAFGAFRDGLMKEMRLRQAGQGEAGAMASLEAERVCMGRSHNHSQLQKLASLYWKKHRKC